MCFWAHSVSEAAQGGPIGLAEVVHAAVAPVEVQAPAEDRTVLRTAQAVTPGTAAVHWLLTLLLKVFQLAEVK